MKIHTLTLLFLLSLIFASACSGMPNFPDSATDTSRAANANASTKDAGALHKWGPWTKVSTFVGHGLLSIEGNADGRLELLLLPDPEVANIYNRWQTKKNNGWNTQAWNDLGNPGVPPDISPGRTAIQDLDLGLSTKGHLVAFASGQGLDHINRVWNLRQESDGQWSWDVLHHHTELAHVSAVSRNDSRLEVFSSDPKKGTVWSREENAVGRWQSKWQEVGQPENVRPSNLIVGRTSNDHLAAFVVSELRIDPFEPSDLWIAPEASSPQRWPQWGNLGHPSDSAIGRLALANDGAGRLSMFTLARTKRGIELDNPVLWQVQENSAGGWGGWDRLGVPPKLIGPIVSLASTRHKSGRIVVVVSTKLGAVAEISQTSPGGPWGKWRVLKLRNQEPGSPDLVDNGKRREVVIGTNDDGLLEIVLWANGELWRTVEEGVRGL